MKKLLITAFAAAGLAISANAQTTLADLDQSLTPVQVEGAKQTKIIQAARANPTFYASLKAAGYVFDGVKLLDWQVGSLQFVAKDYDAIDSGIAAKHFQLPNYKTYIAYKLGSLGNDTLAAYDYLQSQRLVAVQSQSNSQYQEKLDFLDALAAQVLAAAKAKQ